MMLALLCKSLTDYYLCCSSFSSFSNSSVRHPSNHYLSHWTVVQRLRHTCRLTIKKRKIKIETIYRIKPRCRRLFFRMLLYHGINPIDLITHLFLFLLLLLRFRFSAKNLLETFMVPFNLGLIDGCSFAIVIEPLSCEDWDRGRVRFLEGGGDTEASLLPCARSFCFFSFFLDSTIASSQKPQKP